MNVTADDFRRRYAELSDVGLRAINPEDLTPVARECYVQELAQRGLATRAAAAEDSLESTAPSVAIDSTWVEAGNYPFPEEARFFRDLLRDAGLQCSVSGAAGQFVNFAGGRQGQDFRLMVPAESLDEAREILEATVSEEDLIAQAEAETPPEEIE